MRTQPVWITWTNTDLTEGRGEEYPLAICETKSTALRLGRGKYVMGSDCRVTEEKAIYFEGKWRAPFKLIRASKEDIKEQKRLEVIHNILEKAKAAGFSEDEIKLINSGLA